VWANNSQLYSRLAGALISLLFFMTITLYYNYGDGFFKFFGPLLMTRGLLGWLEHPRAYAFVRPWGQIVLAIYIACAWIGITLFLFPAYELMPIFVILTIADVLAQLILTISHRQQHLSVWRFAFWCIAFTYVAIFSLSFFESQPGGNHFAIINIPVWIFAYALLKILFGGNLLY
jgi:hypothetical protein